MRASSLAEFYDCIKQAPLGSIYYHFYEARKRNNDKEKDDFSSWLIEELDEKEKVQMKHVGWKSGSLFGIFMWLSGPLIMNLDYPNGLIAPKVLFFGLMCGLTFGLLIQLLAKARQK